MAFDVTVRTDGDVVKMTLIGELDAATAPEFQRAVEEAAAASPRRLVLFVKDLTFLASAGLRVLIFATQKLGDDVAIHVVAPQESVLSTLEMSGFDQSVYIEDAYTDL